MFFNETAFESKPRIFVWRIFQLSQKLKLRFLAGFLPLPPLLVFFLFFRSGFLGLSWALFLGSGMFCIGCKEVTTVLLEPGKERLGRNVELLEHRRLVRGLLQLHWGDHGAPDESHGQDLDLKMPGPLLGVFLV